MGGDSSHESVSSAQRLARLRWRCRRGMRELDVLLQRYLEQRYASASKEEQQAFEALLELPDPELFAYVVKREQPSDPQLADVIERLTNLEH
jgi:antitoxin CptB